VVVDTREVAVVDVEAGRGVHVGMNIDVVGIETAEDRNGDQRAPEEQAR
jgi:hypothetical protein